VRWRKRKKEKIFFFHPMKGLVTEPRIVSSQKFVQTERTEFAYFLAIHFYIGIFSPFTLSSIPISMAMRKFHSLSANLIKRLTIPELDEIRIDFCLAFDVPFARHLRIDYVQLISHHIMTPKYMEYASEYARVCLHPFREVPDVYRTRDVCLRSGIFDVLHDIDKSFRLCLEQVTRHGGSKRIPMERFTPDERLQLIRASSSYEILRRVSPNEIEPWLERWPMAIQFIPLGAQTANMCRKCILCTGWALQYCNKAFVTPDLENDAVRITPYAIQWVSRNDPVRFETLCERAVAIDGWAVEYVPDPSVAIRNAALLQDWTCRIMLRAPFSTEELAIIAVGRTNTEATRDAHMIRIDLVDDDEDEPIEIL
jgi:hypothetical protein